MEFLKMLPPYYLGINTWLNSIDNLEEEEPDNLESKKRQLKKKKNFITNFICFSSKMK